MLGRHSNAPYIVMKSGSRSPRDGSQSHQLVVAPDAVSRAAAPGNGSPAPRSGFQAALTQHPFLASKEAFCVWICLPQLPGPAPGTAPGWRLPEKKLLGAVPGPHGSSCPCHRCVAHFWGHYRRFSNPTPVWVGQQQHEHHLYHQHVSHHGGFSLKHHRGQHYQTEQEETAKLT